MRTTLTLDPDVAALIERARKERNESLKKVINDALRHGLAAPKKRPENPKKFVEHPRDLGKCLLDNLDNTAEVLAYLEGEDFK